MSDDTSILSEDGCSRCVATQCDSKRRFEDSNIVTVKSWSDDEDEDNEDDVDNKATGERNAKQAEAKEEKGCNADNIEVTDVKRSNDDDANNGKRKTEDSHGPSSKKFKSGKNQDVPKNGFDGKKITIRENMKKSTKYESGEDRFSETSYYFQGGLRKVYPYEYTFKSFAKGRWIGQKILDVFSKEFRAQSSEEYDRCLKAGTLSVNGEKVEGDYVLKHNDLIANIVHRHEVPVTAEPIEIVHLDKDIVVINKPASIPVHPCGRYRHNTVVFVLAKEYNLKNLRTVHRLDRLTSGILIFCRTASRARELENHIRSRHVLKEYVCRVEGNFPDGTIECIEPIEVVSYKIGVCRVSPKGKDCFTTLVKLGYNSKTNSSVVLCQPHTGRMHQIRVHLQYLGYPIIRDPLYNHPVFGPEKGKNGNIGKTNEELIQELIHLHNAENWLSDGEIDVKLDHGSSSSLGEVEEKILKSTETCSFSTPSPKSKDVSCQTNYDEPDSYCKPHKMTQNPNCCECKINYRDPKPSDMVMYLHAFSYKGPDWAFKTKLPVWAEPNWEESFEVAVPRFFKG